MKFPAITIALWVSATLCGASLETPAPGTVWLVGEAPRFSLRNVQRPAPYAWSVRNWKGVVVASGEASAAAFQIPPQKPGYYLLEVEDAQRSFAVVEDPARLPDTPDMPFACDTHMWGFDSNRNRGAEVVRRLGVRMVREGTYWRQNSPESEIDFIGFGDTLSAFGARGIRGLSDVNSVPGWAKSSEAGANSSYNIADDLMSVYRFGRDQAEYFRGYAPEWQFANEVDTGICGAWSYAAALKAFALGTRSVDPKAVIVNAGCARTPLTPFNDACFENDAQAYFDVFAFHSYDGINSYRSRVDKVFKKLAQYGVEAPVYITELGTRSLEGAAEEPSVVKGFREHSWKQKMTMAEFIPKSQMTMQELGINKSFFFLCFPYAEENGSKIFGLLHRDYSVKPAFVSYAAMIRALAGKRCLGRMNSIPGVTVILYEETDGHRTIAYWANSVADGMPEVVEARPLTLEVPAGVYEGADAMGAPCQITTKNGKLELKAEAMCQYLYGLPVNITPDVPARLRKTGARRPVEEERVVFQMMLSPDFNILGGVASLAGSAPEGAAVFTVWNFSNQPMRGNVSFSGAKVSGVPSEIRVAPMDKIVIPVRLTPLFKTGKYRTLMRVTGIFNDRKTSALAVPFLQTEQLRQNARMGPVSGAMNPGAWRENTSGKLTISFDKRENALIFRTEFDHKAGEWVYPEYRLNLPAESAKDAYGISFEWQVDPAERKDQIFMFCPDTVHEVGENYYLAIPPPVDAKWHQVVIPFAGLNGEELKMFKIGVNGRSDRDVTTYKIRNLQYVFETEPAPESAGN